MAASTPSTQLEFAHAVVVTDAMKFVVLHGRSPARS